MRNELTDWPRPGTATDHAWQRLTTDGRARQLSATQRLVYVAVAHHHDQTNDTAGQGHTSAATDVAAWTGLPFAAVVPALTTLSAAGWLDGDDTIGYRLATTTGAPRQTYRSRPTT